MACGHIESDPFDGADAVLRGRLEALLRTDKGFVRDGMQEHEAVSMDFELIAAVGAALGDPDVSIAKLCRIGVPLGWRCRLPRTPAVFSRKDKWAKHVGHEGSSQECVSNYKSAMDQPDILEDNFQEQLALGFMKSIRYDEAQRLYGDRLRIAALGAIPQGDTHRVIHDGTHGVQVNSAIRVRD